MGQFAQLILIMISIGGIRRQLLICVYASNLLIEIGNTSRRLLRNSKICPYDYIIDKSLKMPVIYPKGQYQKSPLPFIFIFHWDAGSRWDKLTSSRVQVQFISGYKIVPPPKGGLERVTKLGVLNGYVSKRGSIEMGMRSDCWVQTFHKIFEPIQIWFPPSTFLFSNGPVWLRRKSWINHRNRDLLNRV